jgi:hypothetical protein
MATAHPTVDHDEIRRWAEKHGARPAKVDTGGEGGVLRFDFESNGDESKLTLIEWDEFFEIFEDNDLAVLLSDADDRNFSKFVSRPKDLRN